MLIYFVLVPILIAIFLFLFPAYKVAKLLASLAQGALLWAAVRLFLESRGGDILTNAGNYSGFLGITLRADTLSAIFVMLTVFIFLIVTIYSFHDQNSRLFLFLLFTLEGALIGLFLTQDLFNIFVLAEVASVVAAVLLMYNRRSRSMYDGLVYLMVNVIVMQFYLLGLGYLYRLTGVFDMERAALAISTLDQSQLVLPFSLVMLAVASKCGLLPLFTFLPKIHSLPQAPASVGALLSGLQVKAGLYLFLRFREMFAPMDASQVFLVIGALTALFGVVLALSQSNIKQMLAYSTIAQVGLILMGLNLDGAYAFFGSVYHMIGHAIAKVVLFLGAGLVTFVYGTGNMAEIRGVFRRMPAVGIGTILAISGITGAPFFSGNISKYFMMADVSFPFFALMVLINLGTIIVFIKYAQILFGKPPREEKPQAVDRFKQASVLFVSVLCLIGGVFGQAAMRLLFGVDLVISFGGFLEKTLILAGSWIMGFLVVRYLIPRYREPLYRLGRLDLSFRKICISIGGFFALSLVVFGFLL